ncbi:MAG: MoaD/ThiS family protein [Anaerolineae bacterium]|nr:MoaD/ThiS family protein [Anaerolineae bacterium]
MSVTLVPVGGLKNYVGGRERVDVQPGRSVEELLEAAGIDSALVAAVLREDEIVSLDHHPRDGETLKLIAVMGGG